MDRMKSNAFGFHPVHLVISFAVFEMLGQANGGKTRNCN